jgi:Xaa-Pro aminopeptidase
LSDRPERLAALARECGADVLLVTELVNVRWLCGFTGSSGVCVVGDGGGGEPVRRFITDFRYEQQAAEQLDPSWTREIAKTDAVKHFAASVQGQLVVGFDDEHMPVKQAAGLDDALGDGVALEPAGGLVEKLRAIKDPEEIKRIRAATELADAALTEVLERGFVGRTESAVALDLEFTIRKLGAEGVSFPSIIAAGAHGALPHAAPRAVKIEKDTLCVVDWGAQLDGYASDCTRTFATGELDSHDNEIYELVLSAQLQALGAVVPGARGKAVDSVARDIISAAGHGGHFGHGLGHGVGAEVHESPRLSQRSDSVLAPGHVVTVEPGVYVPGIAGVRIEDLVLVTDDGHDVLTSLPKTLTTVG